MYDLREFAAITASLRKDDAMSREIVMLRTALTVLTNTLKGAPRLNVPSLFRPQFMEAVQKEHPEYFADLPPLK